LLIPVEEAYKFHHDLPNDTLVILSNVGHVPMEESPNQSLEAVLSLKELMTCPGHSIRDFLEGKRINHDNAFGLLVLLIATTYLIGEYSLNE
jgi:hypothetical protein